MKRNGSYRLARLARLARSLVADLQRNPDLGDELGKISYTDQFFEWQSNLW